MKTKNYVLAAILTFSTLGMFAQQQKINTEKSTINWVGKKIGGQHEGFIKLKTGQIELKDNTIISGTFTVDMNSMTNTDISNETYSQKLVGHLKSDDFFGVEKFPTAQLKITKATPFMDQKATVTGEFTIKGKTQVITFEMIQAGNGYTIVLNIDRSKFDIKYGSKSFFDSLGDKAIDDIFVLNIKLVVN